MIRHFIRLFFKLIPASRFFAFRRLLLRIAGVTIGNRVCFCGAGGVYGRGDIIIGDDTWFSPGCVIFSHKDAKVTIGSQCDFGPFVKLVTGTHKIGTRTRRAGEGLALPISIGNGCWIGANSLILGGVTIGNGVVVAAGSVVICDIPDNTLAAGVPAIVKRKL